MTPARVLGSVAFLFFILVLVQGVQAAGTPLSYGVETAGSIDISGENDTYSVPATAGDHLFFRMGTNSYLPELLLYSPTGTLLATNVSPNGYNRAEISLTASETGSYLLLARISSTGTASYGIFAQRMLLRSNCTVTGVFQLTMSTLSKTTSGSSFASCSSRGLICRHGPHQSA